MQKVSTISKKMVKHRTSISSFSRGVFSSASFWPSPWPWCSSWSVCILFCRGVNKNHVMFLSQTVVNILFHLLLSVKMTLYGWQIRHLFDCRTSPSLSLVCSVSMGSSVSSDFCTSTREALDTLKIPWMFTRTLTFTLELSPDACGTTFWIRNWPVFGSKQKKHKVMTKIKKAQQPLGLFWCH